MPTNQKLACSSHAGRTINISYLALLLIPPFSKLCSIQLCSNHFEVSLRMWSFGAAYRDSQQPSEQFRYTKQPAAYFSRGEYPSLRALRNATSMSSCLALSFKSPSCFRFIVAGFSGACQHVTFSPRSPGLHTGSVSRVL
jgi:hypothetical protein